MDFKKNISYAFVSDILSAHTLYLFYVYNIFVYNYIKYHSLCTKMYSVL